MSRYFVISDIHGCFDELQQLLTKKEPGETLVFLGDYIDRGPDSRKVLEYVRSLVQNEGAIALKGNHEDMFLDILPNPEPYLHIFAQNGGLKTLDSFRETPEESLQDICLRLQQNDDLLHYLKNLPFMHETPRYLFVHAGSRLGASDWQNTPEQEAIWSTDTFLYEENKTGRTVVFGHIPTPRLPNGQSGIPWLHPSNNRLGIDGGCVFGHCLIGVHLCDHNDSIRFDNVPKTFYT